MSEQKKKVMLAYSGGLDTSCILKWLMDKGYEVICFMADVGQDEDFSVAKEKALKIGATRVIIKDLKNEFVTNYIWPAIQMGLIYEGRYLLGTSLARPCITVGLMDSVKETGAQYISHGATGKGNDQVRFEFSAYALMPSVKVIAPWRLEEFCDRFQGRVDLIEYAKKNGIPVSATTSSPWSTDANIMHISYESGILEDPEQIAPENLYQMTRNPVNGPQAPVRIEIEFVEGLPTRAFELLKGETYKKPFDILQFLNKIGGNHGVGRIDIVENRFIGMKSRGVYETPGGTILYAAHHDLEIFCLDREVYRVTKYLRDKMADYVYNGFWFSPESEFVRKCLIESQKNVTGTVIVEIFKGNVSAISRKSTKSLYNQELVSMDVHGQFSPSSATGFIDINSVRIKEYNRAFGGVSQTQKK